MTAPFLHGVLLKEEVAPDTVLSVESALFWLSIPRLAVRVALFVASKCAPCV